METRAAKRKIELDEEPDTDRCLPTPTKQQRLDDLEVAHQDTLRKQEEAHKLTMHEIEEMALARRLQHLSQIRAIADIRQLEMHIINLSWQATLVTSQIVATLPTGSSPTLEAVLRDTELALLLHAKKVYLTPFIAPDTPTPTTPPPQNAAVECNLFNPTCDDMSTVCRRHYPLPLTNGQLSGVGRTVAQQFRAEFPGRVIRQVTKNVDGFPCRVNVYPIEHAAWLDRNVHLALKALRLL